MSVELAASYQGVLRCSIPFKLKLFCAYDEKSEASSYEVLHCTREIILVKLKI